MFASARGVGPVSLRTGHRSAEARRRRDVGGGQPFVDGAPRVECDDFDGLCPPRPNCVPHYGWATIWTLEAAGRRQRSDRPYLGPCGVDAAALHPLGLALGSPGGALRRLSEAHSTTTLTSLSARREHSTTLPRPRNGLREGVDFFPEVEARGHQELDLSPGPLARCTRHSSAPSRLHPSRRGGTRVLRRALVGVSQALECSAGAPGRGERGTRVLCPGAESG